MAATVAEIKVRYQDASNTNALLPRIPKTRCIWISRHYFVPRLLLNASRTLDKRTSCSFIGTILFGEGVNLRSTKFYIKLEDALHSNFTGLFRSTITMQLYARRDKIIVWNLLFDIGTNPQFASLGCSQSARISIKLENVSLECTTFEIRGIISIHHYHRTLNAIIWITVWIISYLKSPFVYGVNQLSSLGYAKHGDLNYYVDRFFNWNFLLDRWIIGNLQESILS